MQKTRFEPLLTASALLVLASIACGSLAPVATSKLVATEPARPTATAHAAATPRPTATLFPTPTLDTAATQEIEAGMANVQNYVDQGYLPSSTGTLESLADFNMEMAKRMYLNYDDAGIPYGVKDFAAWGDVKWSSAGPVRYPDYSGCGFGFRLRDNGDGYTVLLTNERVVVSYCYAALLGNRCPFLGKTRGTGTVQFDNPAEAHFELIVSGTEAVALVDGKFVGSYTLFTDKLTEQGYFLYSMISGTNKDYGTRCAITNAKLWVPDQ